MSKRQIYSLTEMDDMLPYEFEMRVVLWTMDLEREAEEAEQMSQQQR